MIALYEFGQQILPNWLQCTTKCIERLYWEDLEQYDIFLSITKGSDNASNYTIGTYNNWVFNTN